MTKEDHANKIIATTAEYFMAQRIKPDMPDYVTRLVDHHKVMQAAMKTKQTVDEGDAAALEAAIARIGEYYK